MRTFKRSIILGSAGFVGPHLKQELEQRGHKVFEFDLKYGNDIRDYEKVRTILDALDVDYIFHLAAMVYVGESQADPQRAIDTQITGSLNILEAVRKLGIRPKILFAGTSEEYGYENQLSTVTEESPTLPTTVYGATKNAMTNLARVYTKHYGQHIVITRAFNHLGAGQAPQSALSAFAKQIVNIERGDQEKLTHGNLQSRRNFTHVKDIARAYAMAVDAAPGIYNVCSSDNPTMQDLLKMLTDNAKAFILIEEDERLYRPDSLSWHDPSYAKLHEATGWEPQISLKDGIKEVLNDWRTR